MRYLANLSFLDYFFPNVVTSIVVVRFGQRLRTSTRLHIGFWIFAVCLIIIPLIDGAGIQQDATGAAIGSWSWYVTLVTAGLTGCADAIAQGSLFGMAANMPERYTAAGFTGTAASGVIAQLVRIITNIAQTAPMNMASYSCHIHGCKR